MIRVTQRARLLWACRRGMLELDILLERFCKQALGTLTPEELLAFERLLETPDPELLNWLMDYEQPEDKTLTSILARIQSCL